jgi:hypothetical protein
MADFPELEPATRRYSLGAYPTTNQPAWGTGGIRFKHGNSPVLPPVTLTFALITTAEAQLIEDHFADHDTKIPFNLPLLTFRGNGSSGGPAPLSAQWRYSDPPEIGDLKGGRRDVTVQLECVG